MTEMGTDRITIKGLRTYGFHGLMPFEQEIGQQFVLDLVLFADLKRAGETDRVENTIHYGEAAECAVRVMTGQRFGLIEAAAEAVASALLEKFSRLDWVRVTVHKPHAPIAADFADVSVTIERGREEEE